MKKRYESDSTIEVSWQHYTGLRRGERDYFHNSLHACDFGNLKIQIYFKTNFHCGLPWLRSGCHTGQPAGERFLSSCYRNWVKGCKVECVRSTRKLWSNSTASVPLPQITSPLWPGPIRFRPALETTNRRSSYKRPWQ